MSLFGDNASRLGILFNLISRAYLQSAEIYRQMGVLFFSPELSVLMQTGYPVGDLWPTKRNILRMRCRLAKRLYRLL